MDGLVEPGTCSLSGRVADMHGACSFGMAWLMTTSASVSESARTDAGTPHPGAANESWSGSAPGIQNHRGLSPTTVSRTEPAVVRSTTTPTTLHHMVPHWGFGTLSLNTPSKINPATETPSYGPGVGSLGDRGLCRADFDGDLSMACPGQVMTIKNQNIRSQRTKKVPKMATATIATELRTGRRPQNAILCRGVARPDLILKKGATIDDRMYSIPEHVPVFTTAEAMTEFMNPGSGSKRSRDDGDANLIPVIAHMGVKGGVDIEVTNFSGTLIFVGISYGEASRSRPSVRPFPGGSDGITIADPSPGVNCDGRLDANDTESC